MAEVTLTIRDDGDAVTVEIEATPPVPITDGHPDVDHPDFTTAMAVGIEAAHIVAGMGDEDSAVAIATADTVVVELPREIAEALADHPANLQPDDDPGLVWVRKVQTGTRILKTALAAGRPT